jgi:hypothetical protein
MLASMRRRKMRRLLWPLLLLAGCSAGPERVVEERAFAGNAPRGEALLRSAMIAAHDRARAQVGAAPLAWDATLAANARAYAEDLARTRRFAHSAEPRGATPQGENLWTGTRGAYRYEEMIGHWIDERRFYRRGVTPNFSTTGKWQDVAHYTQIVWGRTTRFGCAMAHNASDEYLVCRYTPPGNVVGEVP